MFARQLDDRGVEAAAQPALGGGDDQQVDLIGPRAGEKFRRTGLAFHGGGKIGQHHAMRVE
jgi:hypothetical protein